MRRMLSRPFALRLYGLVNRERQGMPDDEMHVAHTGHDIERTVDGERNDRELQFIGQHEGSAAERAHVTIEGAGSFGKDNERHTFAQNLACLLVGLADFAGSTFVDKNVVGAFGRVADKGNTAQLIFHHPLEIAVQETVDEKDVERSLVIGHEDVALSWLEVLPSGHFHGQEEQADGAACPVAAWIITPEMAVAQGASQYGDNGDDQ